MLSLFIRHVIFSLLCLPALSQADTLRVAVASNFSPALHKLLDEFHRQHAHIKVQISAGASGQLYAQILQGAPFDLYLAANASYPAQLHNQGLTQAPVTYTHGRLLLISQHKSDNWLTILRNTDRLALANPALAPYGARAAELLQQAADMNQPYQGRLMTATAVSQVQHWFASGHIDSAFAAASLQPKSARYTQLNVTPLLSKPIKQQLVVLNRSQQKAAAQLLIKFLLSDSIQQQLHTLGYETVSEEVDNAQP